MAVTLGAEKAVCPKFVVVVGDAHVSWARVSKFSSVQRWRRERADEVSQAPGRAEYFPRGFKAEIALYCLRFVPAPVQRSPNPPPLPCEQAKRGAGYYSFDVTPV